MSEPDDSLPGEESIRQLWVDANRRAVEIADSLGLSDEDLLRIQERWVEFASSCGHPMVAMTKFIMLVRAMRVLVDGDGIQAHQASLSELLFREPCDPSDN